MTTTNIQKHLSRLRNYLPVLSLLVAIAWGGSGCSKDEATPEMPKESVFMNINTRALNSGDEQINTVRILLVSRNIAQTIDCNVFEDNPSNPLVIKAIAGNYDVYVVANETAGTDRLPALQDVKTLGELKTLTLPFSLADRTLTKIPMLGEVKNVVITVPTLGVPSSTNLASVSINGGPKENSLPVKMVRMASKVTIKITSSNKSLTSASLKNVPNQIPLFEDVLLSSVTKETKSIDANLFILTESTTDKAGHILECKDILIPSWIFADATDISKAIQFEFSTTSGDTYTTELGHQISVATKDYTIKRNHNYSLIVGIKDRTMTTTSIVESWKEEDLNIEDDNPVVPTP